MRLKALEVSGFKSFAGKTVLNFTSDITGIVGPNGCGKSNVVDALRWAMGEQSARYLRGQTMEDVIFSGSEQLAPIGMAEVTALLDNSDGTAPADYGAFAEIAVTRRLFRSGESEYCINRVPCRLRDVVELFMGTGVGNKSYSIIGQGRVEELVNSKPEDRRRIIEEAAGTSRFKSRRQAAERKMERTRQNLLRVNDIVREVERQLHKIELQARKAERYRNLQEQLKGKELRWAAMRRQGLEQEIAERGGEVNAVEDRITSLTATVRAREAECERSRVALLELDGEIRSAQERFYQHRQQVKGEEQRIGFLEREEQELEGSVARTRAESVNTGARLEAVASEIADLGKASEDFAQLSLFEEECVTRIEVDVAGLRTRIETLQATVERERELLVDRVGAHSQLTNTRRADEQRLERLRAESGEKEGERSATEETLAALDGRRTRESGELEQCETRTSEMDERRRRADTELESTRAALAEHEEALARLKEDLQEARSGLSSLETLQKNFEGYQDGVRAVMFKHQSNGQSDGICGVVADFIEAPEDMEKALTAVLGERLQYVIVQGHEEGVEAIEYLKRESAGRSGFIPRRFQRRCGTLPVTLSGPDVIAPLLGLVEVKEGYGDVADYLLGDVAVVRDLESGLGLWRSNGFSHSLVTLDGEVIDPMGVVTGGSAESLEGNPISRRRRIRELEQEVATNEERVRGQEERVLETRSELQRTESERQRLTDEARDLAVAKVQLEHELLGTDQAIARSHQDLATIGEELAHLSAEIDALTDSIVECDTAIAESERERLTLEARVRENQSSCRQTEEELRTADSRLTASRIRAVAAKEKEENSRSNLENRVSLHAELASQLREREAQIAQMIRRTQEVKVAREQSQARIRTLRVQLQDAESEVASRRQEYDGLSSRIREAEEAVHLIRPDIDARQQDMVRLQALQNEKATELRYLCDDIRDKYTVELAEYTPAADSEAPSAGYLAEEVAELRSRVQRMGEVNLAAIGEFEELTERNRYLGGQREDLERSMADLQQTITKLNRICRLRFKESFEKINQEFQVIFPRLFDGGKASLTLTDENDYLETGVDIVAQPPGKKLQSISLLSGGEKALTAVSLLFAIFLTKPSPFCFLDEVDAPLDDVNLERFIDIVREMTRLSQFMIITHNKKTMLAADVLYGITMEDPGVSKIVSVEMV